MDCPQNQLVTDNEYRELFLRKAAQKRIPLTGGLDLTYRCNFRCVHCYIAGPGADRDDARGELDASQWRKIIDDIAGAGCLFLLLTGGDPLLRSDFCEIYRHAKNKGLLVTVFTNGTTLTDEILDTFRELPPKLVEITLYGASEDTYRQITGKQNGLAACLAAIEKLRKAGVEVGLKTILMTLNRHEFQDIKKIAEQYGLKFRYDPAIFPRFDGDNRVTRLRLAPREVAEIDFSDPQLAKEWVGYFTRREGTVVATDRLYLCGSGLTSFHINAMGMLQPCLMARSVCYDLTRGDFQTGWQEVIPRIRKEKADPQAPCSACDKIGICDYCPPFAELENNSGTGASDFTCALAEIRLQKIKPLMEHDEIPK